MISTRLGDLDVVQGLEGVPLYGELRAEAIDVGIAGVTVAICALGHLRAEARGWTARDVVDLDDLEAAQPDDA